MQFEEHCKMCDKLIEFRNEVEDMVREYAVFLILKEKNIAIDEKSFSVNLKEFINFAKDEDAK